MIAWPTDVNTIIRNETTGGFGDGLIIDEVECGKKKTRLRSTMVPDAFSVFMIFTVSEFEIFTHWYKYLLRFGARTFQFPKIAGTGLAEYRIIPSPSWAQFGSDTVKVTMTWESA